jgi:hypothetical protein
MNDPERLLLGAADEHERALLAAAVHEEPSPLALARLQRTLGLSVDPAPLTGLRRPPETSPTALPSRSLFASKWLLLGSAGLAVVGALVGALALTRAAKSPQPPAPTSRGALPAAPTQVVPPSALPGTLAHDQGADDPASTAATPPALRDELVRLELARTQLRSQRARAAASALDDYDRVYPLGTLREEALALRIETLFALHEPARAAELARSFFLAYPHSVHGTRVRGQLEQHGAR